MKAPTKRRAPKRIAAALLPLAAALLQAGCIAEGPPTQFDRTLKVDGPVHLEILSRSGKIVVRGGAAGVVRIHGEVRGGGFLRDAVPRRLQEIAENPPIEQSGNTIRLGRRSSEPLFMAVSISYTVETPADTEVKAKTGSGGVQVSDVKEAVTASTGSGSVDVENAGDDVSLTVGSGSARAAHLGGNLTFQCGSGAVDFDDVREEIRGTAGSGDIRIDQPRGRVTVRTGSGGIRVNGAAQDLRANTSSGNIVVSGKPAPEAFWDLGTSSGRLEITVPADAGFALTAHTSSGSVQAGLPIMIEEQSRRVLRARVGDGRAHVNLQTSSGSIRIRQSGTS